MAFKTPREGTGAGGRSGLRGGDGCPPALRRRAEGPGQGSLLGWQSGGVGVTGPGRARGGGTPPPVYEVETPTPALLPPSDPSLDGGIPGSPPTPRPTREAARLDAPTGGDPPPSQLV